MKTNRFSTNEELNSFADLLLDKGFSIISPNKPNTWFFYSKDNKIGYVQYERIGGVNFSTVHKPNKKCGTGYRITDDYADLSIVNAESALCFAPHWAVYSDVKEIVKYKDLLEFTKKPLMKDYIVTVK